MKPIKPLPWRRRAAIQAPKIGMGDDPVAFKAMLHGWVKETQELAKLTPSSFPQVKTALLAGLDKDALLAAEVTLPLDPACDVSNVAVVMMRRPYGRCAEQVLVDVSRLPAP